MPSEGTPASTAASNGSGNAPVKLSLPLSYQQDIFTELRREDELVILARGLGLLRIVTNLLHSYDAAGNSLVVLVGADDRENGWIGEALAEHAAVSQSPKARGLRIINTEQATVGAREKLYAEGGILSITSRILITDLLSKLLDPETVTGLVVLHAERIVATSTEAFIARVYRQFNKIGFLKAFSDSPESFVSAFAPLSAMMRHLFLRKPSLWPRFHVTVKESLEGRKKAEVIELEVPMTEAMKDIQNATLECIDVSISELRKLNVGLELDDWTMDSALHKNFDQIIRRQLDPVWHGVTYRTRQIVHDLSVLRAILHSLLSYDAVSLVKYLDTILAAHSPPPGSTRQNQSPWLFLEAADVIFSTARNRVYTGRITASDLVNQATALPESLKPVLEEQPKWAVLGEVLDEIERDLYMNPMMGDDSNGTLLIMCSDNRACRQIREFLQTMQVKVPKAAGEPDSGSDDDMADEEKLKPSGQYMMRKNLRGYLNWKRNFSKASEKLFDEMEKNSEKQKDSRQSAGAGGYRGKAPPNKRRRVRGGSSVATGSGRAANGAVQPTEDKDAEVAGLIAEIADKVEETTIKEEVVIDNLDDMDDYYQLYDTSDLVIVHPYDGDMDEHILEEAKPRYIIMYEPDAAFIRRVEVYRSSHTDRNVRVYFMYYGGSVEEQRYLSAVRREKDAFTKLIREKGSMAVTLTHDAAQVDPQEAFLRTVNTRIAGGGRLAATASPPTVVVDTREFRSPLASLLHAKNMLVVPVQLTVADYVLSPTIAIERKSVPDLIQSLRTGRLHSQATTLLHHYANPMLLIEFHHGKSFTLQSHTTTDLGGSATSSKSSTSVINPTTATSISKTVLDEPDKATLHMQLVAITLLFPRLKIIWSSSPYQSAEIFAELKKNQDEPDVLKAAAIGMDDPTLAPPSSSTNDPNATDAAMGSKIFNLTPLDMLRAIPGVDNKAAGIICLEVKDVRTLVNMSVEELDPLVGREVGRKIVGFFGRKVF